MLSGRTLILLSLVGITAALLVGVAAGWAYGLGFYAASVAALCLLLYQMVRQQRRHPGKPGSRAVDATRDDLNAPTGMIRPQS